MLHRRAWVKVFLNTISASALLKRVFSVESDIMRLKRAKLSPKNLEGNAFIRENEKRGVSRLVLPK